MYNLPNGRVVYLTVEEYLDLTDQDIQYLMSINAGESISHPWTGSSISRRRVCKETPEDDKSIDYQEEYDEPLYYSDSDGLEDDYPDLPDDGESHLE